jgi:anti-sigma factor RsiW
VTDLTCASGVALLMDYLEGVLPAGVSADLEAHVATCPRCTAFVASYRDPSHPAPATAAELPAELAQSLLAALLASRPLTRTRLCMIRV